MPDEIDLAQERDQIATDDAIRQVQRKAGLARRLRPLRRVVRAPGGRRLRAVPGPLQAPMILTHDELVALTGRRRRDAQVRALRYMGIENKIRPDGSVAVLRAHVERELGGADQGKVPREVEPDWSAL